MWARGEEKTVEVQNSKRRCSWAQKFTKFLLKLDKISKIIFQEESLKNLLYIGHSKINKTAVFKSSKKFMAQVKRHKIPEKYFKIGI